MKKEYFFVKGVYNGAGRGVMYLSPSAEGGYYWHSDHDQATAFASERSAYRSVLHHWAGAPIHVRIDTVRVVRVTREIIEKMEVLEP